MAPKTKQPAKAEVKAEAKPAKADKKNPKGELVKEVLPFDLTDDEIVAKAESAGELSVELTELKAEFKAVKSDFTGKINAVTSDMDKLLKCIDAGTEDREVDCTKVHNSKEDTVEYWFEGKIMKERPATELDRQKSMPFIRKQKEEPKFNGIKIDHKMSQAGDDSMEEASA